MDRSSAKGAILVMDDSSLVRDVVRGALEEGGYQVSTAGSWVELNVVLKQDRPDMILMDIKMPSIRGENLCRIIKQSPDFGRIPVVLFSSMEASKIESLAQSSGADGWIHKRMGPGQILEDVDREYRRLLPGTGGG